MTEAPPTSPGPTGTARAMLHAVQNWMRLVLGAWRRSLRVRVAVTTIVVGVGALVTLGGLLSGQVRDSLYESRRDEVLADALRQSDIAQDRFDSAQIGSAQDVLQLARDVVGAIQATGSVDQVLLLRSPGSSTVLLQDLVTDNSARALATDLRSEVRESQTQVWKPVGLGSQEPPTPGIIVGSAVTLPLAGGYELYLIYSLAEQQATLDLLQRVLGVAALALVLLLLAMAWYLTRQVLNPVQQAALTARRLAGGVLDERMNVRGDDELATLARSFNGMAHNLQVQIEQLAELSRVQQRFVADVSHELRTPLTTVRMAAEVLHAARERMGPAEARSAELMATQLDRFEALLADLLEISRFDAGAATLDVDEADLRQVVERVVDLTAPLAERRGSPLRVELPPQPVRVDLDARRVERILRNLLVNAIEHGEGEPIEVTLAADDHAASVVVRDHGIGMTGTEAERVFDRFWRADPARARTLGGTGLGLAISLEDARLHGGTLGAWGSPGEGAAFRLTLPLRAGIEIVRHPLDLVAQRSPVEPAGPADPAGPQALPGDFLAQVSER